jgi:hypothetical protein
MPAFLSISSFNLIDSLFTSEFLSTSVLPQGRTIPGAPDTRMEIEMAMVEGRRENEALDGFGEDKQKDDDMSAPVMSSKS